MAATIKLMCCNGVDAGSETDITGAGIDYITADNAINSSANREAYPITIPAVGTAYSYEKWLRWKCTVVPDTQCTNFKFWGPNSAPGTGIVIYVGTTDTGLTPVVTDSSIADTQQDTNYYDTDHQLSISGTLTSENDETDYLVMQMDVSPTANQGNMAQQTYNYSYDEN